MSKTVLICETKSVLVVGKRRTVLFPAQTFEIETKFGQWTIEGDEARMPVTLYLRGRLLDPVEAGA